jgi:hypothetical protein
MLWFLICVVLCLACKEEIVGVVFMLAFGRCSLKALALGPGTGRAGLGWTVFGLHIVHCSSPTGAIN